MSVNNYLSQQLNQRIEIFRECEEIDSYGNIKTNIINILNAWASVKMISNRPMLEFKKFNVTVSYEIIIRYFENIMIKDKILFGTKTLIVQSVISDYLERKTTQIIADEIT